MSTPTIRACLAAAVFGLLPHQAVAKSVGWDQIANIKEAATRLGNVQKRQGATKAFDFIVACYKTQGLASKYSKYIEACIAQDYVHTQTLATIYARVPPTSLKKMRAPTPQQLTNAMGQRIAGAFRKYSIPPAEAEAFRKLVDKHGFETFTKIVFPNAGKAGADGKPATEPDNKTGNEKQPTP